MHDLLQATKEKERNNGQIYDSNIKLQFRGCAKMTSAFLNHLVGMAPTHIIRMSVLVAAIGARQDDDYDHIGAEYWEDPRKGGMPVPRADGHLHIGFHRRKYDEHYTDGWIKTYDQSERTFSENDSTKQS